MPRLAAAANPSTGPAGIFTRALDAYFGEQPYRAIVLLRDSMTRSDAAPLREPSLYVLGQAFAAIHLYEKSEDSLNALLKEFPRGRFAPVALREMARIFFNLNEYGAVVNLEQSIRGTVPESSYPPEFWYLLGQSNYLLNRREQARTPLQRVATGTAFYPFARYTLAQVEFSSGRSDSAIGHLAEVASSPQSPSILRERAIRTTGMVLYQQKRYRDAVSAYRTIADSSPLFDQSRVDMALAADAAGDQETAREAFVDAMEKTNDDFIRAEARVAVGRFLNRQQKSAAARTLFDQALKELRTREARLREAAEVESSFRDTFGELVRFARLAASAPHRQRMAEDLEMLRSNLLGSMGINYQAPPAPEVEKLSPKSYLFPLLQRHYHKPAIIETFVSLTVEVEDLTKQISDLESGIRGQSKTWNANPPIAAAQVPDEVSQSLNQMIWLLFANFDLVSRFYDAMALEEKIDAPTSLAQKQRALAATTDAIRLVLFGQRKLPTKESLFAMMDAAQQKIASGTIQGMMAQKVRDGFLQEWRTDRDSVSFVMDNLGLKERQMSGALSGVPLRSRNVNLPVLSTMTDWLTALQQLVTKYRYVEMERQQRPWHLSGHADEVASILGTTAADLGTLKERAAGVLRGVARDLVSKEQFRHSLVAAQAEEGIADALYQERSER